MILEGSTRALRGLGGGCSFLRQQRRSLSGRLRAARLTEIPGPRRGSKPSRDADRRERERSGASLLSAPESRRALARALDVGDSRDFDTKGRASPFLPNAVAGRLRNGASGASEPHSRTARVQRWGRRHSLIKGHRAALLTARKDDPPTPWLVWLKLGRVHAGAALGRNRLKACLLA